MGGQQLGEQTSDCEQREEVEDPKKELYDQMMGELPKKPIEAELDLRMAVQLPDELVGQQVGELPHELDQDLIATSTCHSTNEDQTDKQNQPRPFEDNEMFLKMEKVKRSPISADGVIQQEQAATAVLVPEQELEEAVLNICDL